MREERVKVSPNGKDGKSSRITLTLAARKWLDIINGDIVVVSQRGSSFFDREIVIRKDDGRRLANKADFDE